MTAAPPPRTARPLGRDEVRRAVLAAAARRFATEGTAASLRDIASDAGVNIGLIHRHIGNKDELLRQVLAAQARAGASLVSEVAEPAAALEWMFGNLAEGGDYTRIVAWLLLSGQQPDYQQGYPTVDALRARLPTGTDTLPLLAALAMLYGWTVFGDQLLDAFGHGPADRPELDRRLGRLAAQLAELS
ncbi:helix-turn-helix domain-containing protein [Jatrophihabitans sp.]|uniref:TetR/AcrR family transcriptional regulator n=1 Tax=Jatrophihabitans sp. TaxID=1932789 RepID=UPI0030C74FEF|nr:TetR family transcriptional regulator [Jatrophihabitans sp.]